MPEQNLNRVVPGPTAPDPSGDAESKKPPETSANGRPASRTERHRKPFRRFGHGEINPPKTVKELMTRIGAARRMAQVRPQDPQQKQPPPPPETINFDQLCEKLKKDVDFCGTAGTEMPTQNGALKQAVKNGSVLLPKQYIDRYATPLGNHLERLHQMESASLVDSSLIERLTAAVYQHGLGNPAQLRKLLAVISNLYRSFLTDEKRASVEVGPLAFLSPLAMFQNDGHDGPATITADEVRELIGAEAGVVSLPATCADHPILWGALAHEVSGHEITHATHGLLDELRKGLPAAFAGMLTPPNISQEQLCQLWSYWLDEATADVYGILNMGPAFVLNQAAFFAAYRARVLNEKPSLSMESVPEYGDASEMLDSHPTDILRLDLGIGVIQALSALSPAHRSIYIEFIETISKTLASDMPSILISGKLPLERDHMRNLDLEVPLSDMQESARRVGQYIATTKLSALAEHDIQDIETWDDTDELQSLKVAKELLLAKSPDIGSLGDDAQVLAGSTIAVLIRPDLYKKVTDALNIALDLSFQRDPIWGPLRAHRAIVRYPIQPPRPVQPAKPRQTRRSTPPGSRITVH